MTENELKALLARNPQIKIEDNARTRLQDPLDQPVPLETLADKTPAKERGRVRVTVRIVSLRSRRLDETNLRGGVKFLEDALVARGLIPGDAPGDIVLSVEQTKVKRKDDY